MHKINFHKQKLTLKQLLEAYERAYRDYMWRSNHPTLRNEQYTLDLKEEIEDLREYIHYRNETFVKAVMGD